MKVIKDVGEDKTNIFASVGKFLQEFNKGYSEKIEPVIKGFYELSERIGKWITKLQEDLEVGDLFDLILLELDWPPIRKLDIEIKRTTVKLYNENDIACVRVFLHENVMEKFNDDYCASLLSEWCENPLLEKRVNVLEEAMECNRRGNYYASTILILSQVEGVIADGFYHSGRMGGKKVEEYVKKFSETGTDDKDRAFKKFIEDIVLVQFHHGEKLNSYMSRHAIMHGGDTQYGTWENSIKAILLFDYLQHRFCYFHIEGSKTLHLYGCHYLEKSNKKKIGTKKIHELVEEDFKLCKVCFGVHRSKSNGS